MDKRAIWVKAEGATVDLGDRKFTLPEMQALVGGFIEIMPGPCYFGVVPCEMVVNEEGKIDGLPFNQTATDICGGRDKIVGNVFILIGGDMDAFSAAANDD